MVRALVWITIALCRRLLGLMIAVVVYSILGRGPAGRRAMLGIRILRRITRF
ncbi:hypothetical protein [Flavimaricola marinus]|uniref:Uncharacterized protein n=1 Tax=Flavimaricola marinus TaxID=1819565 RepID=A0A238LJS0_9RHOB|nr:hypothetical protein [Flavimaricola marinus]SMY09644.1 hypothetical protein LOM8899_03816 [Flavimaricola marinus]